MKGFIEVTKIWAETKQKAKQLVNVNSIVGVGLYEGKNAIEFQNGYMLVKETYEEIKQKIKESQGEKWKRE